MKKTLISISLLIFFIIIMQSIYSEGPDPVDIFVAKKAREIEKKYHLEFSGLGGGANDKGVPLTSVNFNFKRKPLDISEGRRLTVHVTEELLEAINNNLNIKSFLNPHPFTSKNIEVGIICYDENNQEVFEPYINMIVKGIKKIGYLTRERGKRYGFKSEIYETYAEALAIVNAEE